MSRHPPVASLVPAVLAILVLASAACSTQAAQEGPTGSTTTSSATGTSASAATSGTTSTAMAKLAPALAARLPQLPAEQPIRLIAALTPGTPTEEIRHEVGRLGGRLVRRFTLIDAIVVDVPGRSVLPLAELAEVRGLELDDTGVPPPSR